MKNIITVVLLIVFQVTVAQNSKLIIGKWAYVDLHDKSSVDEAGQQMAAMLFSQLTMNFSADNTMSITMRKKPEPGTYSFDKDNENLINAVSATGKPMPLTIVKLTENELIVTMGTMGAMIMKKVSAEPDAAPAITPKVSATMKQITGKWYVTGSENKKMSELGAELMGDSYVSFSANGKYNSKVLSIEQTGTWKFGKDNKTIVVDTEDGKGIWSIYEISDSELMMQNDTSLMRMTFSKKQL